jgi:multidrug resistance protein MdtO
MLRFLWVIGTFFAMFYALSAMANYSAAVRFGYLVVVTTPLWDLPVPAGLKVEGTLWAVWALTIASVITAVLELIFAALRPGDRLVGFIAERLISVEELLSCHAEDCPVDNVTDKNITRLGMTGTSRLRSLLQRSAYSSNYREQMGAVISLVGRLVDIAANLTHLAIEFSDEDRKRMRRLAEAIANIRSDLLSGRAPRPIDLERGTGPFTTAPLLREMETVASMIPEAFAGSQTPRAHAPSASSDEPRSTLFVADALSNSEHIKFALKGCLAASLCYIIYTSIAWPGISTAVTTCLLTALTTIGASRQKQVLRIAGALAGGVVLGIGGQVFILPHLDSIAGFTLLFVAFTILAAWIATSSPRLSYFGVQLAVAFYLINLQEFKIQISLSVARDRVAGILLGLFMMWLVFDQLWGVAAGVEMKKTFISIFRLLAQLAREPVSRDIRVAIERSYSLRETINTTFNKVRSLGDGVLFEFGPSRRQDLVLRDRIRKWQPQLRMLFITRIALLKYRLAIPGFELPRTIAIAQQKFDTELARMLDGIADRLEGKAVETSDNFEDSFKALEQTIRTLHSEESQAAAATQSPTFLALSRRIEQLTVSLEEEILNTS